MTKRYRCREQGTDGKWKTFDEDNPRYAAERYVGSLRDHLDGDYVIEVDDGSDGRMMVKVGVRTEVWSHIIEDEETKT